MRKAAMTIWRGLSGPEFLDETLVHVECLFWDKPEFQIFEHCNQACTID
jgi:hypothetical protein